MTKKLIALISAVGKTKEEVVKQTWEAFLKYQAVERKTKSDLGLSDVTLPCTAEKEDEPEIT